MLREGDIHPDLATGWPTRRRAAPQYVLQMCIRAIDYCPPVGITFGDYLRAIITADYDLNPDDVAGYRLAFVESFRQWGIHPAGMRSMSVESLLWPDRRGGRRSRSDSFATQDELHALFVEEQPIDFAGAEGQQQGGAAAKRTGLQAVEPRERPLSRRGKAWKSTPPCSGAG